MTRCSSSRRCPSASIRNCPFSSACMSLMLACAVACNSISPAGSMLPQLTNSNASPKVEPPSDTVIQTLSSSPPQTRFDQIVVASVSCIAFAGRLPNGEGRPREYRGTESFPYQARIRALGWKQMLLFGSPHSRGFGEMRPANSVHLRHAERGTASSPVVSIAVVPTVRDHGTFRAGRRF